MQQADIPHHKVTFRGKTGYVIAPWMEKGYHNLIAMRHSADVSPWVDGDVHLHETGEEYYLVLKGELCLLVNGDCFTIRAGELLMVRPQIPHAVIGGEGLIEHLVLRTPANNDRKFVSDQLLSNPAFISEKQRTVQDDWGYRVSLADERFQNCWLAGTGNAKFISTEMSLAYLEFPANETAINRLRSRNRLHFHLHSWEYYLVFEGEEVLEIEDELVPVSAGEILIVPPGTRHMLNSRSNVFKGITFRVPLSVSDKIEV